MFWNYVIVAALFILTTLWSSYAIIIPLIVLRFANPLIKHLDKLGMIDGKSARSRNRKTVWIWLVMNIVALAVLFIISNHYVWLGAGIGLLWVILFGLRKTGRTTNNKKDFIDSYARFFTGDIEIIAGEIAKF